MTQAHTCHEAAHGILRRRIRHGFFNLQERNPINNIPYSSEKKSDAQQEEQPTFAAAASTRRPICGDFLDAEAWTRDTWRSPGLESTEEGATALASIVRTKQNTASAHSALLGADEDDSGLSTRACPYMRKLQTLQAQLLELSSGHLGGRLGIDRHTCSTEAVALKENTQSVSGSLKCGIDVPT